MHDTHVSRESRDGYVRCSCTHPHAHRPPPGALLAAPDGAAHRAQAVRARAAA